MAIKTANDLFIDELKDIYSAEKQAVRIYPRLAKAVSSPELKDALQTHLEETKGQIERLDQVFEILEKRASGKTCEGMKGLIEEGSQMAEEVEQGPVRDAALIAAAQRMEHYEIAAYGTVVAFAKAIGEKDIVQLLTETLEEEKATDKKLTGVSKAVNKQALEEEDGEVEEAEDEGGEEEESEEGDFEEDEDSDAEEEAPAAKAPSKGNKTGKK
jgi:ferritin-like metal-binding protein YciE